VITVATTGVAWLVVAAGGLILMLFLTGWFYWSTTRRFQRTAGVLTTALDDLKTKNVALMASVAALESDKRQLEADVGALRSANESIATQVGTARQSDRDLVDQVGKLRVILARLEEDRIRYEDTVRVMADRSRRYVRHLEHHIVYMIGESASGDITTETYRTSAKNETEPLLWHDIDVGLTNQSTATRSFRDLDQTSVFEVLPNPPPAVKALEFLPTGFRNNRLGVLVFFEPEIGREAREWRLTYAWKGMWDPLRIRHRDTSILRLGEARRVERELVTVSFVFPFSALNPRVKTGPNAPFLQPHWKGDLSGRPMAVFTIANPRYEDYDWVLEVDEVGSARRHGHEG